MEIGCGGSFWLNVLLTILGMSILNVASNPILTEEGFIPGIIHALYIIIKH